MTYFWFDAGNWFYGSIAHDAEQHKDIVGGVFGPFHSFGRATLHYWTNGGNRQYGVKK